MSWANYSSQQHLSEQHLGKRDLEISSMADAPRPTGLVSVISSSPVALCRLAVCCLVLTWLALPLSADISGNVLVFGSGDPGTPVAGARVSLEGDPDVLVISGADGSFTVPASGAGPFVVTAAVTYDRAAAVNYKIAGTFVPTDVAVDVEIRLVELPTTEDPDYVNNIPSANFCGNCHTDIRDEWQTSNHSFAAEDTWVLDLFSGTGTPGGSNGYVFRDLHDPDDTGFCATCHAPMADAFDPGNVFLDEVAVSGALEGVTCVACHQIDSSEGDVNALHHLGNSTYRFPDGPGATSQYAWGPLDDVAFNGMNSSYAPFFATSRICASCHQYQNPNTGAPGQNTYIEWTESPYAEPGPDFRSCQDCHMPTASDPGVFCEVGGPSERPANQLHSHEFIGATPPTLTDAISLTTVADDAGGLLRVQAEVGNHGAGHSFPTGVSIRNALLVIEASFDGQPLTQVSGSQVPFWGSDDVPGQQEGDYADFPGKGFAKVLEGRINGQGEVMRPVLFIDAEGVYQDSLIPAGEVDVTEVEFALPPGVSAGEVVDVEARLLYRRAYRALAVTKGWTVTPQGGPVEIEVASNLLAVTLVEGAAQPLEIPVLGRFGLWFLGTALALLAVGRMRRV